MPHWGEDGFEVQLSDDRLDFRRTVSAETRRRRIGFFGLVFLGSLVALALGLALDIDGLLGRPDEQKLDWLFVIGGGLGALFGGGAFLAERRQPLEDRVSFVWNRAKETLEEQRGNNAFAILDPTKGDVWVHLVLAPWEHTNAKDGGAMDAAFASVGETDFLVKTDRLREESAHGITRLHPHPRAHFEMAVVLFRFLLRAAPDCCTYAVLTTKGSAQVSNEAELDALLALTRLPVFGGVQDL